MADKDHRTFLIYGIYIFLFPFGTFHKKNIFTIKSTKDVVKNVAVT